MTGSQLPGSSQRNEEDTDDSTVIEVSKSTEKCIVDALLASAWHAIE